MLRLPVAAADAFQNYFAKSIEAIVVYHLMMTVSPVAVAAVAVCLMMNLVSFYESTRAVGGTIDGLQFSPSHDYSHHNCTKYLLKEKGEEKNSINSGICGGIFVAVVFAFYYF